MKTWHRHLVLWGKAKRELAARHRWFLPETLGGETFMCSRCGWLTGNTDTITAPCLGPRSLRPIK